MLIVGGQLSCISLRFAVLLMAFIVISNVDNENGVRC